MKKGTRHQDKILRYIERRGEVTVRDIAVLFSASTNSANHWLKNCFDADLLSKRVIGAGKTNQALYSIKPKVIFFIIPGVKKTYEYYKQGW